MPKFLVGTGGGAYFQVPNKPALKAELQIIIPPLKLQSEFMEISRKVKSIGKLQEDSTMKASALFNSLMSKAFKGELE